MSLNVAFYSDALPTSQYGLGRYARELLRHLREVAPEVTVRPVSARAPMARDESIFRLPYPRKIMAGLWSSIGLPRLERWTPWADLVHCVELDYRISTRKPLVVTIHDIGPLTHPEFFRKSHPWLLKTALKFAIDRAAAIICVSRATADAVQDYMNCRLGERLTIVPEGVSEDFFRGAEAKDARAAITDGAPYFFWAGSLNPRKNLARVLQAFEQIAPEVPHYLVLTGGSGWDSHELLRRIQNSPAASRIDLRGHVSDEELRGFYRGATSFVYVSLMEGFGLPILEAMACGCPVITSNLSSMPEVAGDAAFLVNPLDITEIAKAMHCMATDTTFAKHLSIRGRARAEEFHWETCALAVAGIYQRVTKNSGQVKRSARRNAPPSQGQQPVSVEREEVCVEASSMVSPNQ